MIMLAPLPPWKVTRLCYDKYQRVTKDLGIRYTERSWRVAGLSSIGELIALYRVDQTLAAICPYLVTNYIPIFRSTNLQLTKELHDHEIILIAKHCLKRDTLGLKPQIVVAEEAPWIR